jgi:hypothetical protein
MRRKNIRGDGILMVLIILSSYFLLGNTGEYFFINKKNLKHVNGIVSSIEVEYYSCSSIIGRRLSPQRCAETTLTLKGSNRTYHIRDYVSNDPFLPGVTEGDNIAIYYTKWYQRLMAFNFSREIYCLESEKLSYDNITSWKRRNKAWMIVTTGFLVVFGIIYLIQRSTIKKLLAGKRV